MPTGENFPPESTETRTTDLFQFLFCRGDQRGKLRELGIRYSEQLAVEDVKELPVPRVEDITGSCPFVTKLALTSWIGSDKLVTGFWEGLSLLEEVELEKCEMLGDMAFLGEGDAKEEPVFLKLKHLRKVSLKGLDSMPKVTDLVFKRVFCRLKIKQFRLTSDQPLKSVSASGIESLIDGDFNSSVEKFPFDDWSLDGISDEDFLELKLKFRASHMI